MEEIAHDPVDSGGIPVKKGVVKMSDISNLEASRYGVDDSGRTIVPRTTISGGIEGSDDPFGGKIVMRIVDQDENGMKITGQKLVTGMGAEADALLQQAPQATAPVEDTSVKEVKKKKGTTPSMHELQAKLVALEAVIAGHPSVVAGAVQQVTAMDSKKPPVMVTLSGAFGSMTMPYYDAIESGACIILVSEISLNMPAYTPPERIPIELALGNRKVKVMHLGLEFTYEGRRLLVLIVES
jgi:hypothetical protein